MNQSMPLDDRGGVRSRLKPHRVHAGVHGAGSSSLGAVLGCPSPVSPAMQRRHQSRASLHANHQEGRMFAAFQDCLMLGRNAVITGFFPLL